MEEFLKIKVKRFLAESLNRWLSVRRHLSPPGTPFYRPLTCLSGAGEEAEEEKEAEEAGLLSSVQVLSLPLVSGTSTSRRFLANWR